ncbi:MAG: hypothetical protein MUP11_05560, partial [Anaerolineales bacterium]|nr:hypothetical protein [Anaerolineales bacterium]
FTGLRSAAIFLFSAPNMANRLLKSGSEIKEKNPYWQGAWQNLQPLLRRSQMQIGFAVQLWP